MKRTHNATQNIRRTCPAVRVQRANDMAGREKYENHKEASRGTK